MTRPNEHEPVLIESPASLRRQGIDSRFAFLLLNVSRACNFACPFCWTASTEIYVKNQARMERIEWFDEKIMQAVLKRFKERGGYVVAVMAEGAPLIGINDLFIKKLASATRALDVGLLIFTNGEALTENKIEELKSLNPKISYAISLNAGTATAFNKLTGRKNAYERLLENKDAWRCYNQANAAPSDALHRIGVHTVISAETTNAEMQAIQTIVKELGNTPWIVTTMGLAGAALDNPDVVPKNNGTKHLIETYATGPTVIDPVKKNCCYIVSEHHDGVYGLTLHPFNNGSIQPCPYLSHCGSASWFTLKSFVKTFSDSESIGNWLDYAVLLEALITSAAFQVVGYEHCIMRHQRLPLFESFLTRFNTRMKTQSSSVSETDQGYFKKLTQLVVKEASETALHDFAKEIQIDAEKIKDQLGLSDLLT